MKISLKNKTCLLAPASLLAFAGSAPGAIVLELDLSVTNEITLIATDAAADNTVAGGDIFTGIYIADIFAGGSTAVLGDSLVDSDFAAAANGPGAGGDLYNATGQAGLNLYNFASGLDFTAGEQAFSGSGTWTLSPDAYAELISGNTTGDVYAPADTDDDLTAGAAVIGQWTVTGAIPEPSTSLLGGLAALALLRRRRK